MNFKTFYINHSRICYRELLMEDSVFEKCYYIENPRLDDIVAIPDGCVDLQFIWENGVCRGYVCGSFLRGKLSRISVYQRCFGLKLHPGFVFSFLKKNVAGLIDSRVPLAEFMDCQTLERDLAEQHSFPEMVETACRFFRAHRIERANNISSSTADIIFRTPGTRRVSELVELLGYSQRYLNHVFKEDFGLPVKKYADIIRVQAAIQYLETRDVMDVISGLGYYDQAHFIRDFKQHTSLTPKFFVDGVRQGRERAIV